MSFAESTPRLSSHPNHVAAAAAFGIGLAGSRTARALFRLVSAIFFFEIEVIHVK
jgi:hypothetical protein